MYSPTDMQFNSVCRLPRCSVTCIHGSMYLYQARARAVCTVLGTRTIPCTYRTRIHLNGSVVFSAMLTFNGKPYSILGITYKMVYSVSECFVWICLCIIQFSFSAHSIYNSSVGFVVFSQAYQCRRSASRKSGQCKSTTYEVPYVGHWYARRRYSAWRWLHTQLKCW